MVRWVAAALGFFGLMAVATCGSEGFTLDPNLGGETTRFDATRNSFSLPAPDLTTAERRAFEVGDSFFTQNWVTAPASTEARDGLGPTFNAQACSSCHVLDGRGAPPLPSHEEAHPGLLIRLSIPGADAVTGAPVPDPHYGGQLQDRSILGVPAEGTLRVSYEIVAGTYGDGTTYELRMPTFEITDLAFGPLDAEIRTSPRLAPQVIGMGLLEAIPADEIMAAADPDDADGDGISGRANIVWDARLSAPALGRFGWKANVATVEQQAAGAFLGDIGVTSLLHPDQNCPEGQTACAEAINGGSPEIAENRLGMVTIYMRTLSVPAMRGADTEEVRAGAQLFEEFGCASCHTVTHQTGVTDIAALSEQTIHPYTDLLLHDMGEGLADGREDFGASGREWRTPPLWGIGLIDEINGERFLLHDGRARTLAEAILWHGGEAEASKEEFRMADAKERTALIAFLEAL